ncbi:hypothetical protein ScalyP_jg3617, partial [Parmales sp. scaly parma]
MIDQLLQKQQKFLQNMADGIDGDEIDPFQDFTKSPVNDNNRPMSSRPMSARRKSVPNLNIIHEGKGTKMTVNNPNNTPNQKLMLLNNMAAMTSPGVHKARQRRRSSVDAITVTEDIFAPRMLGELSVGASAVVASSKIAMTSASASIGGSPEFKGDNDEEKL